MQPSWVANVNQSEFELPSRTCSSRRTVMLAPFDWFDCMVITARTEKKPIKSYVINITGLTGPGSLGGMKIEQFLLVEQQRTDGPYITG